MVCHNGVQFFISHLASSVHIVRSLTSKLPSKIDLKRVRVQDKNLGADSTLGLFCEGGQGTG